MPSATPFKETKAEKTERLKLAKDPWEAFAEIRRFALEGRDSVPEEWSLYFRWWVIYSQVTALIEVFEVFRQPTKWALATERNDSPSSANAGCLCRVWL